MTNPRCASCHNIIDPLGFAFGHFDGVGQWRCLDHEQAMLVSHGWVPRSEAQLSNAFSRCTALWYRPNTLWCGEPQWVGAPGKPAHVPVSERLPLLLGFGTSLADNKGF